MSSKGTASTLTPGQINSFVDSVYPDAGKFRCEAIEQDSAVARWVHSAEGLRPGGFVSGPTLFAAADVVLWYLSFTVIGLNAMAVTANLSIDFLRPAVGGDVMARAQLLHAGKRRISGRVDMWIAGKPDKLVAHATGTYMVL